MANWEGSFPLTELTHTHTHSRAHISGRSVGQKTLFRVEFHFFGGKMEDCEDDFDRFCRIGMGTGSEYSPVRPAYRDFLTAPVELNRNRAGSLRETRQQRAHQRHDYALQHGRFDRTTTADDFIEHGLSPQNIRRHSLAPSFQNLRNRNSFHYLSEDISDNRPITTTRVYTPNQRISPSRNSNSGGGSILAPPINVYREGESPNHHGSNIVRVRSFRRTKTGVVDETEKKRRMSSEMAPPVRKTSKTRNIKPPSSELKLSDRCETARSIRRRSFTDISWNNTSNSNAVSECSECEKSHVNTTYKVQVLGADQVGKTTMCTQFLTSRPLDDAFDSGRKY